jgi:copper oxidase (laccase) domain-containing protein
MAPVAEAASVEKPAQVQDGSILNDHNAQEHAKEDQVMNNEEQISEDSQVQENLTHVNQTHNGSDSNIDVNLDDQSRAVP